MNHCSRQNLGLENWSMTILSLHVLFVNREVRKIGAVNQFSCKLFVIHAVYWDRIKVYAKKNIKNILYENHCNELATKVHVFNYTDTCLYLIFCCVMNFGAPSRIPGAVFNWHI